MTRARILADYVAGGTTAAEFDYMDGVTSNVQTQMDAKAPLASPVLVTPNLGIPSAVTLTNATFPAGHVLQVVSASASVEATHNSDSSWATKAVPATSLVTKKANSKIYIIGHSRQHGGNATNTINVDFRREITGGASTDNISGESKGLGAEMSHDYDGHFACNFLDSPSVVAGTTLTYKFNHKNHSGVVTHGFGHADMASVITLMEVAV